MSWERDLEVAQGQSGIDAALARGRRGWIPLSGTAADLPFGPGDRVRVGEVEHLAVRPGAVLCYRDREGYRCGRVRRRVVERGRDGFEVLDAEGRHRVVGFTAVVGRVEAVRWKGERRSIPLEEACRRFLVREFLRGLREGWRRVWKWLKEPRERS